MSAKMGKESKLILNTTIGLRNNNYCESKSTINRTSYINKMLSVTSLQPKLYNQNKTNKGLKEIQRPISCPVQDCAKIIAIDSVLLHFYFDHNKVPLLSPDANNTMSIVIDAHKISESSKCIALIMQHDNKSIYPNEVLRGSASYNELKECTSKYNTQLLLMAAKYCPSKIDFSPKAIIYNEISNNSNSMNRIVDNNDSILLWFCKLQETKKMYSITISGDKKGISHSYSGEATYIRDCRNAHNMYDKAECLAIRVAAINKLFNNNKMLKIEVTLRN